jgi:aspartate 1-decarboxylase
MKRIFYLILIFIAPRLLVAQTLFVANNNPGAVAGVNGFVGNNAIQQAINTSANGDIIYVVPSSVNYNSILVNKEVTIFGIGIRPDKALGVASTSGIIDIDASNVRLSGMTANNYVRIGNNSNGTTLNNIIIENVESKGGISHANTGSTLNNILFRNCIMRAAWFYTTAVNTVTVSNCVIYTGSTGIGVPAIQGVAINWLNNLFIRNGGGLTGTNVDNCLFDHNIFYGTTASVPSSSNNNEWNDNLSFGNNVVASDTFSIGLYSNFSNSPNLINQDPMFINMPFTTSWLDEYDFTLQAGSPALNVNGTDIGPSGGTTPFDYEGNILPLIQSVTVSPVIPVGSDLPVTIKAKGN